VCDLETSRIGAPYIYIYIYIYTHIYIGAPCVIKSSMPMG